MKNVFDTIRKDLDGIRYRAIRQGISFHAYLGRAGRYMQGLDDATRAAWWAHPYGNCHESWTDFVRRCRSYGWQTPTEEEIAKQEEQRDGS